jgi:hypothetical protein
MLIYDYDPTTRQYTIKHSGVFSDIDIVVLKRLPEDGGGIVYGDLIRSMNNDIFVVINLKEMGLIEEKYDLRDQQNKVRLTSVGKLFRKKLT